MKPFTPGMRVRYTGLHPYRRKEQLIGKKGTIVSINREGNEYQNYALIEVMFDEKPPGLSNPFSTFWENLEMLPDDSWWVSLFT